MKTAVLGKVSMKTARGGTNPFNFGRDINTTGTIGDVNPLAVTMVNPESNWRTGNTHFIRMAPLVCPSFARLGYDVTHQFVPFSDLSHVLASMFAQTPESTTQAGEFQVEAVPHLPRGLLAAALLFPGAKFSIYEVQESSVENTITYIFHRAFKSDGVVVNDEARAIWDAFNQYADYRDRETTTFDFEGPTLRFSSLVKGYFNITSFNSRSIPVQNPSWASFFDESEDKYNGIKFGAPVRLHGANFIIDLGTVGKYHLALGVRLSSFGKRNRKILIGCGQPIDFSSTEKVSLLPLFAYWKAYYDRFGIQFNSNYYVTNLAKIMKSFDAGVLPADLTNVMFETSASNPLTATIWKFVHDLGSCWYTEDQDFVSAHISDLTNSAPAGMAARFIDTSEEGFPIYDAGVVDGADGQHSHIDQVWHGNLASEYLKRIYRWINRNTIAGKRIEQLLRAQGLGDFVDHCRSNFIGHTFDPIDIFDVVSQSDTLATSGDEGVNLGAQAGMGIGKIKDKKCRVFKYTSNEHGFVVSMYSIVPSSGYVQGVARQNRCIRKLDFYNAEFDALGMETSSKSDIVGANDWPIAGDSPLSQTFGFIPRYSGLKVVQNIANGDFSLRGVRDNFLPFMLDKFMMMGERSIDVNDKVPLMTQYITTPQLTPNNMPTAGETWRYLARYQWMNNFKRIFAQKGRNTEFGRYEEGLWFSNSEMTENLYDEFIIHNRYVMDYNAHMKAIEDSFETDDEGKTDLSVAKA